MTMATNKPDLEALKQAHAEAKAVHRDAVKAVLDAKRVADRTHWRVTEARSAYWAARPPSTRPRPKRTVTRKAESVFPEDE
jgi:hypothetical protein